MDERELLAEYAHEAWSGWMQYMIGKSLRLPDGGILIPPPSAERWTRQMNTAYADLPESEKESDRAEADKMLEITEEALYTERARVQELEGKLAAQAGVIEAAKAVDKTVGLPCGSEWQHSDALANLRRRLKEYEMQEGKGQ